MKKKLSNILLSILLLVTIFVTVFSLTILNGNFIKMNLKQNDYYNLVYQNIIEDLSSYDKSLKYELKLKDIKKDINSYISSRYDNKYFKSKVVTEVEDSKIRDIYNKNIKFDNLFEEYNMVFIIYGIYFCDLLLIIITGSIFVKTKKYHDLSLILIICSVVSFIVYGICYIINNIDLEIMKNIFDVALHYYLAINILLLEYGILKRIKKFKS